MRIITCNFRYGLKFKDLPNELRNDEFLEKHSIELEKSRSRSKKVSSKDNMELPSSFNFSLNEDEYWLLYKCVSVITSTNISITNCGITNEILEKFETINEKFNEAQQFNKKVNVYQPNNIMINFNEVESVIDCNTEHLQTWLDQGWHLLSICPQPDQKRPDYILARYIPEELREKK